MAKKLPPILPGEILLEEFLRPMNISQNALARAIGVPVGRINDIIHGRRSITLDTAARLGIYFRMSAGFWLNLQNHYDKKIAERDITPRLQQRIRPFQAA